MDASAYIGTEAVAGFRDARGAGAMVFDPAQLPGAGVGLFDPQREAGAALAVPVGGRGAAWFVHTPAGAAVLRHYRRGGMAAKLSAGSYLWQGAQRTRSFREFRLLQALRARGLPVPPPLAAAYWRAGAGYRAALLTLRIEPARSLGALVDAGLPAPWDKIGITIARFHRAGACHADLNVDNLLMDADDDCWMIDFDRGAVRRPALQWQLANLARLRRSLRKRIGARADTGAGLAGWERLLAAWNESMRVPA
ncbi:MAG: 3-deoxy-D-manno-octulosonic acid kinase [Proteobacteria bacterium]|nr:3-deoxy-D-manno-octulosonic acid kinase [Pseudomonadota bacterium]